MVKVYAHSLKTLLLSFFCLALNGLSAQFPPPYVITHTGEASTGYYFLTAVHRGSVGTQTISFNLILDGEGDLFYFKKFTGDYKATDFKLLPDGRISYFSKNTFYLMDRSFTVCDSISGKNNFVMNHHELKLTKNGHFLILCTEELYEDVRPSKLIHSKSFLENAASTVSFGVIQELDQNKNPVFEWRSRDHFQYNEMDTFYIKDPKQIDLTHCNAIEEDTDGNLLLSSKNFNEITKIDRRDGHVIWRLGGIKNQFTFINDSVGFNGQHNIVRLPDGNITLFDNGRAQSPFRPAVAKEYTLDEKKLTSTLVWSYTNDSAAHSAMGMGNVQRLANGNTLVNYGNSNKSRTLFNVVTPQHKKIFELYFKDNSRSYRVFNYTGISFKVKRPQIKTIKKNGVVYLDAGEHPAYLWSNGARTRTIPYIQEETMFVCVPVNDGGYVVSTPFKPGHSERNKPAGK